MGELAKKGWICYFQVMKIAVIVPPLGTLPARGHGGTERIAQGMIDELIRRGHQVTLIGAGDCQTEAEFVQIFPKTISEQKFDSAYVEASRPLRIETAYIAKVMKYFQDHDGQFEVVFNHMRGGFLLLPLAPHLISPIISTLHLPLFEEVVDTLAQFDNPNIISISNSQRKPAGGRVRFLATVYNGLDPEEFPFNNQPEDYFFFMGAIGEHKSPHLAIDAAKAAGVKLTLAGGKIREPYFSNQVKPKLDNDQIKFVGEVEGKQRLELLSKARGLLMPITWEEPFGLVMIEAMACGTPVIGLNHGAVPEVIENGQTGFVVNSVEGMAEAIGRIDQINRRNCRQEVEKRFTYQTMVDGYLAAYQHTRRKQ